MIFFGYKDVEFGDPQSAYRMHKDLFDKYGKVLAGSDRAEALSN